MSFDNNPSKIKILQSSEMKLLNSIPSSSFATKNFLHPISSSFVEIFSIPQPYAFAFKTAQTSEGELNSHNLK